MPSYKNLAIAALAASSVSPALSAPIQSSQKQSRAEISAHPLILFPYSSPMAPAPDAVPSAPGGSSKRAADALESRTLDEYIMNTALDQHEAQAKAQAQAQAQAVPVQQPHVQSEGRPVPVQQPHVQSEGRPAPVPKPGGPKPGGRPINVQVKQTVLKPGAVRTGFSGGKTAALVGGGVVLAGAAATIGTHEYDKAHSSTPPGKSNQSPQLPAPDGSHSKRDNVILLAHLPNKGLSGVHQRDVLSSEEVAVSNALNQRADVLPEDVALRVLGRALDELD